MKFTLIKNVGEYKEMVTEVFQSLVGSNIKTDVKQGHLVIYHNYDNDEEIEELLLALETGMMVSIHAYVSQDKEEVKLRKELNVALKLIDSLPNGVYDLKGALLFNSKVSNPNEILDYILEHTGITVDFIKDFIECDLNVSRASKEMFIHRNTMNYKLDKLKELSGFDLRVFKDAYVLYSLISDK